MLTPSTFAPSLTLAVDLQGKFFQFLLILFWANKKKKKKLKKGGWVIYFGKRIKRNSSGRKVGGRKGKTPHVLVGLSSALRWKLRLTDGRFFRVAAIHVGYVKSYKYREKGYLR